MLSATVYCFTRGLVPVCILLRPDNLLSVFPVEKLVRDIEQYQGLRALRLEGNTLGVEAARAIAKALENKDLLQVHLSSSLAYQCCSPSHLTNFLNASVSSVNMNNKRISLFR